MSPLPQKQYSISNESGTNADNIIDFPANKNKINLTYNETTTPSTIQYDSTFIDALYSRLLQDMTKKLIQENINDSFSTIYLSDLEPDLLHDSFTIIQKFANKIVDKSNEIDFQDNYDV